MPIQFRIAGGAATMGAGTCPCCPFALRARRSLCMYVGRGYGGSAILSHAVELIEDDSVRVGDTSPRPNPFPEMTKAQQADGYVYSFVERSNGDGTWTCHGSS